MKLLGITSILAIILFTMLLSKEQYKEPSFTLLDSKGNIEIRQYKEYIVAKTSIIKNNTNSDNNMFRVLASYIFGGNTKNESIPMTAPVTTFEDDNSYNMLFYMLESNEINDLPSPSGQNITFDKFNLGKCAVIKFSWYVNDKKISKYQKRLENFINDNDYKIESPFMVNRYDSPWTLPFMRRNEVLVKIQ
tara:strand:- start:693 stop:1265 length:573 start_codon:yes stop_codon:yes gene_type:complete